AINQSPLKHPPTICSLISFFSNSERRQSICSPTQKHNLKDGETTTPCYISSPFGTFCRFINPGPAPDELLLQVLPQSRTDRARLRHQAHLQRPFLGRSSPQDALPRLLRQGVRCFCDDQLHGQQHGGESRRSQPDAPWVQLHRRPQDPAREGVPRSRLLRRYPRSRRQRLRRMNTGRSKLASSHGKKRRQNLQLDGGTQRHPSADQQHHHAPDPLRQCRPRLQGPRPPLRGAHDRDIALQLVLGSAVQLHGPGQRAGPGFGQRVRDEAEDEVREHHRQRDDRGDGPGQLPDVRPQLLPAAAEEAGAVPIRRRFEDQLRHAVLHQPVRVGFGAELLLRVRQVHGEDGPDQRQDRVRWRDPEDLCGH
ncbi:unnamed protein product, partial [Linum tenue]